MRKLEIYIREDSTVIHDLNTEENEEFQPEWIGILIDGNYVEITDLVDMFKNLNK